MRSLLIAVTLVSAAFAQTRDTAAVFGTVTDSQGAAIPGATVRLTSNGTGQVRSIAASTAGEYLFPSLPVGTYSLTVEQPAFKRYEGTGILLQANENVKLDIVLEVGDVKTTVSVDAAAGGGVPGRSALIHNQGNRGPRAGSRTAA